MKSFVAICFLLFGIAHLRSAFTVDADSGSIRYPRRILGVRTNRVIHFAAGAMLLFFGWIIGAS